MGVIRLQGGEKREKPPSEPAITVKSCPFPSPSVKKEKGQSGILVRSLPSLPQEEGEKEKKGCLLPSRNLKKKPPFPLKIHMKKGREKTEKITTRALLLYRDKKCQKKRERQRTPATTYLFSPRASRSALRMKYQQREKKRRPKGRAAGGGSAGANDEEEKRERREKFQ